MFASLRQHTDLIVQILHDRVKLRLYFIFRHVFESSDLLTHRQAHKLAKRRVFLQSDEALFIERQDRFEQQIP